MIYPPERKDTSNTTTTTTTTTTTPTSPISPMHLKVAPGEEPPAYAPGPSNAAPLLNRVNYFHINEDHNPIEGSWTVDPSLRIPEAFLPNNADLSKMENLHLYSHHKSVTADLALVSETACKSVLSACSKHKEVKVVITKRTNQRFRLTASSKHKDVRVYLPRDFEGPISFKSGKGGPDLSEGVKQRLMMFGSDRGSGKAFMGRWDQMGDIKTFDDWQGDEAIVTTKHGKVYLAFADELAKTEA